MIVVIIDSREQLPYEFENSEVGTLNTGDYSVKGLEPHVCVERKTKSDAYASVGRGRDRFEREFERMAKMSFSAVVIESSLTDFLIPPPHSRMNPRAAISTLLGWSVRFFIPVFFADNRQMAQATTYQLLEKYYRYFTEDRLIRENERLDDGKEKEHTEKETDKETEAKKACHLNSEKREDDKPRQAGQDSKACGKDGCTCGSIAGTSEPSRMYSSAWPT